MRAASRVVTMLSVKYDGRMKKSDMAKALGRLGGQARAARLSPADRARIASLGGHARRESLQAARRIEANFRYVAALDELRPAPTVKRAGTGRGPLPGLHPAKR